VGQVIQQDKASQRTEEIRHLVLLVQQMAVELEQILLMPRAVDLEEVHQTTLLGLAQVQLVREIEEGLVAIRVFTRLVVAVAQVRQEQTERSIPQVRVA
jgi:hypothetical protein